MRTLTIVAGWAAYAIDALAFDRELDALVCKRYLETITRIALKKQARPSRKDSLMLQGIHKSGANV